MKDNAIDRGTYVHARPNPRHRADYRSQRQRDAQFRRWKKNQYSMMVKEDESKDTGVDTSNESLRPGLFEPIYKTINNIKTNLF